MLKFAPIAYEDFSHLNAQWQEERPAVAGLGSISGRHDYVDLSYLNAHYRPIQPAGVGTGNGILSGNLLGIGSALGEDPSYPWREYSADTKALQQATNEALRAHGYAPITEDGKLGPATCGAVRTMCGITDTGCSAPGTCQEFTGPSKAGGGGSLLSKSSGKAPTTAHASMFGGGGGQNWLLIGGAVAAMAVGGALIYKATKK